MDDARPEPARMPQMRQELDRFERSVTDLEEALERLESRLSCVMTPPTPTIAASPQLLAKHPRLRPPESEGPVALVSAVRVHRGRIETQTERVEHFLQRLEI